MDWTIQGVIELGCWIGHFPHRWPTGHDAEDCIDAHIDCNIRHLVWELGRSVLAYHSDLPGASCKGFLDEALVEGAQPRAVEAMYRERCQLRAALQYGRERGCTVYGRLSMNRHYSPGSPHRGRFAQNHPQLLEMHRDGRLDVTRLSFGAPEYRRERVEILMEAARIGCEGLCLDFCRQPPAVRYHPSLVNPWRRETGRDPRELRLSAERDEFLAWCEFRARSVTALLVELKEQLDQLRERYDREIPVQVRIPNDGIEANLICGFAVEEWCSRGLIDEIALSELRWIEEYQQWDDQPYLALGREHDIPVYAGNNCLPVQRGGWSGECNPRGVNPWVMARRALAAHDNGAAGVCVYQSDLGVQWPGQMEALATFADPEMLRGYVEDPQVQERHPVTDENRNFGIDNHSSLPGQFISVDEL
ncbi:MAG: hypothetical protein U9R79_14545 [Armatimonadota bacterium]|nr:hypothetical protein [Armatimonadota bacterium]